jgi:hypothetical protein
MIKENKMYTVTRSYSIYDDKRDERIMVSNNPDIVDLYDLRYINKLSGTEEAVSINKEEMTYLIDIFTEITASSSKKDNNDNCGCIKGV